MGNQKPIFFIDIDNTLLANDHIKEEIKKSLISVLGEKEAKHFWHHHDEFREYKKLVDFPNIIHIYCGEVHKETCDITLNRIFNSIEFSHALYPDVKAVLMHLKTLGKVVLFTEGDSVYQKIKIEKSGLSQLVNEVALYKHKWQHLPEIIKKHKQYKIIFIDDRSEALLKAKEQFPQIFIIEVCQGHYSTVDHKPHAKVDKTINSISELLSL